MLVRISPARPVAASASAASGWRLSAASAIRAVGPSRYTRPSWVRAWSALEPSRWCSSNASPQAPGARSRPSVETMRPSLYGYSDGCRSATSEAAFHHRAVVGGHRKGGRVSQEVRGVEHVQVERVALDVLTAVQEPPQGPHRGVDLEPVEVLERVDRRHLVRDRADPADAGHDVDHLVAGPPDDEALEVPGRLEDAEARLEDLATPDVEGQRALALDAGDVRDAELALLALRTEDGRAVATAVHRGLLRRRPAGPAAVRWSVPASDPAPRPASVPAAPRRPPRRSGTGRPSR